MKLFNIFIIVMMWSCKPVDITDPIPMMQRVVVSSHTEEFESGLIGLETAFPLLERKNILYKQKGIAINQINFVIERQNITDVEPYTIFIGKDLYKEFVLIDTIVVSEDIFTKPFYKRISCSDPVWAVYSDHPIKVYVEMILFIF